MEAYFGIMRDVAIALITGVVASAAYERLVAFWKSRKLRNQFASLQGQYDEYVRTTASQLSKTGGTIRLTYRGGTKFTTDANNSEGKRVWHGELFMREDAGVLGAGFYSYDSKDDTGVHSVIYNPELDQFDVSGQNMSHPEGAKDFKMIWRRKQ
jgi:hypothetical protein